MDLPIAYPIEAEQELFLDKYELGRDFSSESESIEL
jgi:hypothetical protein